MFVFSARADWINFTGAQSTPNIAEICIEEDRIRMVLEIYVKDIASFIDLIPEDWVRKGGGRVSTAEKTDVLAFKSREQL